MVKKSALIFSFLSLMLACQAQDCYQLVWSDEFSTNGAPDPAVWGYDLGSSGFGNNEVQNYTNESDNVRIENGLLIIEARKTSNGWTSARLKSQGKKSFTYGKIEFRAKLPAGKGTWPALWMLGENVATANWPACGEIDVMEHVGKDPGNVHASLHSPSSYGATQNTAITTVADFSTAFHTYVLDWTDSKMDFYVDDKLFYTYAPSIRNDNTWPFNKPFFVIMNVAMGGNWGSDASLETGGLKNGIDPSLTTVRMEVDYIRYYSKTAKPKVFGKTILNTEEETDYSASLTNGNSYQWTIPSDAQIMSGLNTPLIHVRWGATSGNVNLAISTPCGNISADPFPVIVRTAPTTSAYQVPLLNASNNPVWEVIPTSGNTITLSAVADLEILYNISLPKNNPCIRYSFPGLMDFSPYKYISFTLKTENNNPPSVIRLDMVDINDNNNQDNIFKIYNFPNDNQFHTYAIAIATTSTFDLSTIKELKLYLDYGIYPAGSGKIWLREVAFLKENPITTTLTSTTTPQRDFVIYPNPASDVLYIEPFTGISHIEIFNINGQLINQAESSLNNINISRLYPGIYNLGITDKKERTTFYKFVKIE
jgi:beta-glucanase (GH16 family)